MQRRTEIKSKLFNFNIVLDYLNLLSKCINILEDNEICRFFEFKSKPENVLDKDQRVPKTRQTGLSLFNLTYFSV